MIRILASKDAGSLLKRKAARLAEAEKVVGPILDAVRKRGDRALLEYARKFDGLARKSVRVPESRLVAARRTLDFEFAGAVVTAAEGVLAFARASNAGGVVQGGPAWLEPGTDRSTARRRGGVRSFGALSAPLDCGDDGDSGPGGWRAEHLRRVTEAAKRSARDRFPVGRQSFLRNGRRAGHRGVCVRNRNGSQGGPHCRAGKYLRSGGQETAGRRSRHRFRRGPTEILIIAEEGDPRILAADMLAQAEHDVDASAILLTTSKALAGAVAVEVERQLADLPTAAVAAESIARNSAVVVTRSLDEAVELSNQFAPEHLSIPDESLLASVRHAGSVFIGPFSPEAAGDYASGPNHVLPTGGAARMRGGLSVTDFVKVISVQSLSSRRLAKSGSGDLDSGARRRPGGPRAVGGIAPGYGAKDRFQAARTGAEVTTKPPRLPKGAIRPRPAILAMAPYSPPTAGRDGKLRLDFNENTVGCSPRVIDALKRDLDAGASPSTRSTASAKESRGANISALQPEEFLFTNGTDEAIQVLINTYVDDGRRWCCWPSYAMYRFYAEFAGARSTKSITATGNGVSASGTAGASRRKRGQSLSPIRIILPARVFRSQARANSAAARAMRPYWWTKPTTSSAA